MYTTKWTICSGREDESYMKRDIKSALRQSVTLLGLVALSILYLLEVDYSHISLWNWIAFVIVAFTLVPLAVALILRIIKGRRSKKEAQAQREKADED